MSGPRGATVGRLPAVDVARGAALVAMFGYHLTWDLAHFGYIDSHAPYSPGMRLASHAIASSFLFIAGVSLVLAKREPMDWGGYGRRLLIVAAAAGAVTLSSWLMFPEGLILFGILHCIVAASIVALPFLFLPWPAALIAGAAAIALPAFVASPAFDGAALDWTGLGTVLPDSNDFRPLLPWAGATLLGVGAAAFALPRGAARAAAKLRGESAVARALAFGGRHSLAVYLLHQPAFFALLSVAVWALPPARLADEGPFRAGCEKQCAASGGRADFCARACACTAQEMKRLNLWAALRDNRLDAAEKAILSRVAQECVRRPAP